MKKVLTYSAAALFAAALAFSCQRVMEEQPVLEESKEEAPAEEPVAQPKMITVTCSIDSPDSKVTLTNDGTVGKTAWEMTDEVLFHGKKVGVSGDDVYSYVAVPTGISDDGKTAFFEIPELAQPYSDNSYKSTLFAAYPASAVADFSNGTSWYYVSVFKDTNHLLLAGYNNPEENEGHSFKFVNLTGALSFKVSGDFDAYRVLGNNHEVLGYDKYCVTAAETATWGPEIRTCYRGSSGPGASASPREYIYVAPTDANWANGTTINTVFFPGTGNDKVSPKVPWTEAANFTAGFTILFYKNGEEVKRVSTSSAINIGIGKYLDLGNISSHLYTYVPPATHDSSLPVPDEYADLGRDAGTANCYLIDPAKYLSEQPYRKFKAVKGNGTVVVDNIASVSVLWETWNNSATVTPNSVIVAADYDLQEGEDPWIVFQLPETLHAGNAVIAARNVSGEILWSWHIWVPASTVNSSVYGLGGQTLMDRNLGALEVAVASSTEVVTAESQGLLYSWGRKDPFVAPGTVGSSSWATTAGASFSVGDSGVLMSVQESIQNPTMFVRTGGDDSKDWCSEAQSVVTTLWGSSKTQYDPCPPGYMVPYNPWDSEKNGIWNLVNDAPANMNFAKDLDHKWFKVGDPATVFPIVGYLDQSGYANSGKRAYVWSSRSTGTGVANVIRVDSSNNRVNDERKSRAGSIRCVVE